MKINYRVIVIMAVAATLSSCSPKIPFTQAIRDQYKLNAEDLKHIQFYLSDPVVLRRGESKETEKTTEEGTLVLKSGKDVEQVVFKANTPGAVAEVVDAQKFTVAFEDGAEKSLVFASTTDRRGFYKLQAMQWTGERGKINYAGQTYYSNPGSDRAILLFKMKNLRDIKVSEKVVKGKKVN